jgi:Spy/CpxP family protein refolding chaperone
MVVALILVLLVASPLFAGRKGGGKKNKADKAATAQALRFLKAVTLTPEQNTKLDALKSEFGPKLAALKKKIGGILTPERKAAGKAAQKAAKAAGKKGKAAKADVEAALKLTADQKTQMAAATKELKALQKELRAKVEALLTPEQKALLKKPGGKGKGKKGKRS